MDMKESVSCSVMFNSLRPHGLYPTDLPSASVHGILQTKILMWFAVSFPRDLPDPGIEPQSSALQVDSLLFEPPVKPL